MSKSNDIEHLESVSSEWTKLHQDATLATEEEHKSTLLEALRQYPKATTWSAVVSLCIIMDGYDTALMGSLFGFPAFQKKFGHYIPRKDEYGLDAKWQMGLGMASPVGNVLGVALNGYLTDRYGHKIILHGALLALTGLIFIQIFAQSVEVLLVGQLLCGVPWGMFNTMAPAYASEVAPLVLRSYLETWVVCCWGIGQFFSYAVLFSLNTRSDEWAFRIPFAVQLVWPVVIVPLAAFCPESPWWLVRQGRYDRAERSLMRLTSGENKQDRVKKAVALMIETNKLEQDLSEDTSYMACFRGTDLRRTEIASVSWAIQVLSGFVIQGYATYFFQQAGLNANNSFKMTLGIGGVHLLGNMLSAVLTGNYGRRRLFLVGCVVLSVFMFIIGAISFGPRTPAFGFATSAVYLVWFAIWEVTIGPLPYIINGEVSSTRLRGKTIAIARAAYLVTSISGTVVAPYILNPEWADWGGKTGLLTGGLTIVSLGWAWFRLPETRGRTYEELDVLFAEKLPAREFAKAIIQRDGGELRVVRGNASTERMDE